MLLSVSNPRQASAERFNRETSRARRQQLLRIITGRSVGLLDIRRAMQDCHVEQIDNHGIQQVAVDQITGSESRAMDFDEQFRPLKQGSLERWCRIASAHIHGKQLPAVDLIQIDDAYFVRDGHHRISVAKTIGQPTVRANVVVWKMSASKVTPNESTPEETHSGAGLDILYAKIGQTLQYLVGERPQTKGLLL